MPQPLRVAFVSGTTPDKWVRAWREQRRGPLVLVPVAEDEQYAGLTSGEVDMALVRIAPDQPTDPDLHRVRLYDELPVVVAGRDHFVAAGETVTLDDLADEQLVRPHHSGWRPRVEQLAWPAMTEAEAIETVSAGTGIVIVPLSVARLHHRKDTVVREVTDLAPTGVSLVWLRERDDEQTQAFVGVVKGRGARSSRG